MKALVKPFVYLTIILSLLGCSKSTSPIISGSNSNTSYALDNYLKKQDDSAYLKQYKLLGLPLCDLTKIKGENYAVSAKKDYILNDNEASVVSFASDTMPLNYYFHSEYKYTATDTFKTYLHKYDLLYQIQIDKVGYEVFPKIVIGDTIQSIQKKTNSRISNDPSLLKFESANLTWLFRFYKQTLVSVHLYGGDNYCGDDDGGDHGLSSIVDAFQYVNAKGLTKYSVDKLTYYTKAFLPEYGGWFYKWYFQNDYMSLPVFSECSFPYRVFYNYELIWMNGAFPHACAGFLGKWISPFNPEYELDIEYITEFGEIQFNLKKDDHIISNINGVLEYNDELDVEANYSEYSAKIEYEDQYYGGGYGSIQGVKVHLFDRIAFDLVNSTVYFGEVSWKRDSAGIETKPSLTTGYMRYFGLDDPDMENRTTKNGGTDESKGASMLNEYFNKKEGTSGLAYTQYYFEYVYDYYFKETDTIYFVWKYTRSGDLYYVDLNNRTIILETRKHKLFPTIKKAVWSNGSLITSNAAFFQGNWISDDGSISLTFDKESNVSLTTSGALINEFKSLPSTKEKVKSESDWLQLNYFGYEYGNYDLFGYILLNFYTWEMTLHITRSNIPGIEMGIRKMVTENRWTYGDNISEYTPEEIEQINNESGKTLISVSCISDFYGKVLGKIEIYSNGDQIGYDYYGQIVGYYYQETNTTTDFKGTIVSYGNTLSSLIMQPIINEL